MAASEPSSTAPAASQHVFLYELPKLKAGTKVRLLCCVLDYEVSSGKLHVEHAYPVDATRTPRAYVDVNLLIETTKPESFARGAWVNVIGYVQECPDMKGKSKRSSTGRHTRPADPQLQAVLMWDAGSIKVTEYETALEKQRVALKNARQEVQKYQ